MDGGQKRRVPHTISFPLLPREEAKKKHVRIDYLINGTNVIYTVHNFIFQRKTTGQRDCLTRLLSCILLSCLQQKPQNKGSVIGSVYRNEIH